MAPSTYRFLDTCILSLLLGLASASPSPLANAQGTWPRSGSAVGGSESASSGSSSYSYHIPSNINAVRIAHVVIGGLAVLLFLPGGAVFVRLFGQSFYHGPWMHSGVQIFGTLAYCTAAGLGIWMARAFAVVGGSLPYLHPKLYHPIIGIIVLALLIFLPVGQFVSHFVGARNPELQHTKLRRAAAVHVWLGRLLLLVAIVNGGLGFAFADQLPGNDWSKAPRIAYGVIATIVIFTYVIIVAIWGPERDQRKMSQTSDRVRDEEMQGLSRPHLAGEETGGDSRPPTAQTAQTSQIENAVRGGFKSTAL